MHILSAFTPKPAEQRLYPCAGTATLHQTLRGGRDLQRRRGGTRDDREPKDGPCRSLAPPCRFASCPLGQAQLFELDTVAEQPGAGLDTRGCERSRWVELPHRRERRSRAVVRATAEHNQDAAAARTAARRRPESCTPFEYSLAEGDDGLVTACRASSETLG